MKTLTIAVLASLGLAPLALAADICPHHEEAVLPTGHYVNVEALDPDDGTPASATRSGLWQETNSQPGLQVVTCRLGGVPIAPADTKMLV